MAQLTLVLLFADIGDTAGVSDVLCKKIALGRCIEAQPHQFALRGPHPKGSGDCFVDFAAARPRKFGRGSVARVGICPRCGTNGHCATVEG